jgi:hypothetical protein
MFVVPFMFSYAYRLGMSYKRIRTAGDLVRFRASLRIECTGCAAANTLSSSQVVMRCGTGDLEAIRRRLKCARCGKKDARLIVLPPV